MTMPVRKPTFILCRTNAPLVTMAFDLIKQGRNIRIKIMGRDIAKQMKDLIGEILEFRRKASIQEFNICLDGWLNAIRTEWQEKEGGEEIIAEAVDQHTCLKVIAQNCVDTDDLLKKIDNLFVDTDAPDDPDTIYFASGHRSKGLERKRVIILHPELCPHPNASRAEDIEQEEHIWYVMLTRCGGEGKEREDSELIICHDQRP